MRLFVALRPSAEALAHLQARRSHWPTAQERWHITLAFLGEVAGTQEVDAELRARVEGQRCFSLALEGSGTFGRGGPVWVGVGGEVDRLAELASRVGAAARAAGVELERRRYRPHLTVGRKEQPSPASLAGYRGPSWVAGEVELVRSDIGRTVVHTVLQRYRLSGD